MSEVELREFLENKICALDKRIDERFIALDKALRLQAEKDQKHFGDLNNEQARLLADRERYLPRETYAADRQNNMSTILSVLSLLLSLGSMMVVILTRVPAQ